MSNKTEPLLSMELKPSKRLMQLLAVIHALAIGASIANALPAAVQLMLVAGVATHLYWLNQRIKAEQYSIKHSDALGWEIRDNDEFKPVQILGSTVITTFAIFLHISADGRKQSLIIVNDALSADDYRRLIVRLKTAGLTPPEQS
ncbi:MAG: protein YgfX [Methylobacter sp.]